MTIKVTLNKLQGAGTKQTAITNEACNLLEKAINHSSFAEKLNQAEFRASWQSTPDSPDEEKSAQQVLQTILMGEEYGTEQDQEIDLHIRYKYKWRAVGSTTKGRFPINTAYWFVNKCIKRDDPISLAAHFMHEWTHVAGFYHKGGNGAREDVPYIVGSIVYEILNEMNDPSALSQMM